MPGIFMGPHIAVAPKSPKEGPTVQFEGAAGFIVGDFTNAPVAFKALDHLLLYYEITHHSWSGGVLDVFSLNGVHTSVAIAVLVCPPLILIGDGPEGSVPAKSFYSAFPCRVLLVLPLRLVRDFAP